MEGKNWIIPVRFLSMLYYTDLSASAAFDTGELGFFVAVWVLFSAGIPNNLLV